MGRPPSITYEEFRSVALELVATHQRVTYAALRRRFGGVSHEVLRRYLDQFKEEHAATEGKVAGDVSPMLQALANQARDDAMRQVRAELAADAQALEDEREELAIERAELDQRVVRAEAEVKFLRSRVDELQQERRELQGLVDAERRSTAELREHLARAEAAFTTERAAHAAAAASWEQHSGALVDRFAGELRAVAERFEALQQHALRQVDEARTKHAVRVEQLVDRGLTQAAQHVRQAIEAVVALPKRVVGADDAVASAGLALRPLVEQLQVALASQVDQAAARFAQHVDQSVNRAVDGLRTIEEEMPSDAGGADSADALRSTPAPAATPRKEPKER